MMPPRLDKIYPIPCLIKQRHDSTKRYIKVANRMALSGTCPVRAQRALLDTSCATPVPIFKAVTRHDTIAPFAIVMEHGAWAAGLDPVHDAGHSFQVGGWSLRRP